jgi:hypothetical protein
MPTMVVLLLLNEADPEVRVKKLVRADFLSHKVFFFFAPSFF